MSPPPHHSSTLITRACPDMLWNTERGWRQKKTKQEKPEGMRESEREMGGLREGKDRGCGKGEKNVMLQLQFWVDSQKRSRTESERRGETVAVIGAHGGRLRQGRGWDTCCHWLIPHFLLPLSWYLTEQLHDPPREAWWTVAFQTRRHKDQDVEREWRGAPFLT